jgi:hypothetical protein
MSNGILFKTSWSERKMQCITICQDKVSTHRERENWFCPNIILNLTFEHAICQDWVQL